MVGDGSFFLIKIKWIKIAPPRYHHNVTSDTIILKINSLWTLEIGALRVQAPPSP